MRLDRFATLSAAAALVAVISVGGTLRADDRECARLQKQSEEIDQKIGEAIKKGDETARKHLEEERFKISKPLRKCTCDSLRRAKEEALDRAQNAPTAKEREEASEAVLRVNGYIKEVCGDGKEAAPYDPCWLEKMHSDLARIVEKDKPENKKKAEEARAELCRCLKKFNFPLPNDCEDAAPTLFPGDRSVCDSLKKDYEEKQKTLENAGSSKPAEIRKANQEANEAREKYCECLTRMKVSPLPEDCRGRKTAPPPPPPPSKTETPPKTESSGPKVSPVPPPSKAPSPVPPSRTASPPPPPPKRAPPPPPPAGSASAPPPTTYVCGKTPCDCAKQDPPKVCKAGSGCVCTKG